MSDYPQSLLAIANYLQYATEYSQMGKEYLCASYYCRLYWVTKAKEVYLTNPNDSIVYSFFY